MRGVRALRAGPLRRRERARRSRRGAATARLPTRLASTTRKALRRGIEPLGLRRSRLSLLSPELEGVPAPEDDARPRGRASGARAGTSSECMVPDDHRGGNGQGVRARAQPTLARSDAADRRSVLPCQEMAVRYGRTLEDPPRLLPSGWAA